MMTTNLFVTVNVK